MTPVTLKLVEELDKIQDPADLLGEISKKFGHRAAIGTSGQLSGSALIDMSVKSGDVLRVFTIDTLRLFKETYEFFNAIEKKYAIEIERVTPDPIKVGQMTKKHGENLFFDSKQKQELCCALRKVEPNARVLKTLDVWVTGLRTDQSASRAKSVSRFEIIAEQGTGRPILKVAPLVSWTEEMVRKYVADNQVPIHPLLNWSENGWRYESLGCRICTTPIGPTEARRAGRWRWFKE